MPLDLDDLTQELDLWQRDGRIAAFWWRDDDAVAPTPALARLLGLSDSSGVEVAVAAIPAKVSDALAVAIERYPGALVVQHGYAHENHAPPGAPAVECGGDWPLAALLDALQEGRRRLEELFEERFRSVLAAPWNRIDRAVLDRLSGAGFNGASAYGPRAAMRAMGLVIANAHVDPLNWRERRFAGGAKAVSGIVGELRARRTGATAPDEPLGLLTHHLDHDAATWDFLQEFFTLTRAHPAARWLTIDEAFAAPAPAVLSAGGRA